MRNQAFAKWAAGAFLIGAALTASPWQLAQEVAKPVAALALAADSTPARIQRGLDLFQGDAPFSAGGPSCNSCHNVVHDTVVGGGTLAVDLTEAYGRLESDGILATLTRKGAESPFPLMQAAFQGRDITDDEGLALAAFLRNAHEQRATQKPNNLGPKMLAAGGAGVVALLLLFSLLGRGRKRRSVNQEIYDRQIASE